jgi:plasmid stability protein
MPVMLQVRNLPDDVHAKLKQRAAAARMSLSDYVATELAKLVTYRTNAEILADARRRAEAAGIGYEPGAAAAAVRAGRKERDKQLFDPDAAH